MRRVDINLFLYSSKEVFVKCKICTLRFWLYFSRGCWTFRSSGVAWRVRLAAHFGGPNWGCRQRPPTKMYGLYVFFCFENLLLIMNRTLLQQLKCQFQESEINFFAPTLNMSVIKKSSYKSYP